MEIKITVTLKELATLEVKLVAIKERLDRERWGFGKAQDAVNNALQIMEAFRYRATQREERAPAEETFGDEDRAAAVALVEERRGFKVTKVETCDVGGKPGLALTTSQGTVKLLPSAWREAFYSE